MSNEKRIISKSKLDAIAGAIREKTGSNSTYTPDQMVAAIGAIETQGDYQEKTFTENGTYTPDTGYDAFSQVTVNVQSSGNNPLQDMLDRSSDTNGSNLFYANNSYILRKLTYENLIALDFSNKHYTDTSNMFYYCISLTTIPQLNFSKATNVSGMFSNCISLTTIPQLDFSKVTSANAMFYSCTSLTTIPQLDFSKVTDAMNMFVNCSNLTTIPLLDFSSVTAANSMFSGCSRLTTIPQLNFSKATNVSGMFSNCSRLTAIPQLNFSKATSARYTFSNCTNLTTVPQLDFSSATSTDNMFYYCSSLTTLDFSNIKTIGSQFAQFASSLSTLIIRNSTTLATLGNKDAFYSTPIARGTGYIYVPDDLVDSYKQATNWSTFANQIKPLSELPQGE